MKALDTNLLVRYIVRDDLRQSRLADKVIDGAADAEEELFIGSIALCELVWVLESCYEKSRKSIADVIDTILETACFHIEGKSEAFRALEEYREERGDFADYLMGELNQTAGCEITLTFDKSLKTSSNHRLLR